MGKPVVVKPKVPSTSTIVVVLSATSGRNGTCHSHACSPKLFGVFGSKVYPGMPFARTTISSSVHDIESLGMAYCGPAPATDERSGNTAVGQSPSFGKSLFVGTEIAGASVATTSGSVDMTIVVVGSLSTLVSVVGLESLLDPPHALRATATHINRATCRNFCIQFFST